jgi:hypothetical protein
LLPDDWARAKDGGRAASRQETTTERTTEDRNVMKDPVCSLEHFHFTCLHHNSMEGGFFFHPSDEHLSPEPPGGKSRLESRLLQREEVKML